MILPKSVAPVQYILALSRLCALPGERSFVEFPLSLVRVSRSLERSEGMTAGGHLCGSFHGYVFLQAGCWSVGAGVVWRGEGAFLAARRALAPLAPFHAASSKNLPVQSRTGGSPPAPSAEELH